MKKSLVLVVALVVGAVRADAQGGLTAPKCTTDGTQPGNVAQDACQQAYDVYQFMSPQLGLAITGGNATLGQNSTLGGLGHFSLGVRGNIFNGNLPKVDQYTQRNTANAPAQNLATKSQILGLPNADLAVGIFGGLPLALTNVGGIDLLVSATYVPTITGGSGNSFSVKPDQNLQLGYGARVGLLSESILVPGVSFTYLKRDLPSTTITGNASYTSALTGTTTTNFAITNAKVKTTGWRVVVSKSLLVISLAAGGGQDKYDQFADIAATVNGTLPTAFSKSIVVPSTVQTLTRTNYFVDANINLIIAKLTAEIGQVSGGTVNTYNTFDSGRADKSQSYGALGFRIGF
jgi:hypothetical protein